MFAAQGFEQCAQLAGEARNPQRDLARAILIAMFLGSALYAALQVVLIGAVDPANIANNWDEPLGSSPTSARGTRSRSPWGQAGWPRSS